MIEHTCEIFFYALHASFTLSFAVYLFEVFHNSSLTSVMRKGINLAGCTPISSRKISKFGLDLVHKIVGKSSKRN